MNIENITLLKVEGICKSFGKKIVLNNCSLELPKSTIVGLLGANGSGKTTFLKILIGALKQQSGNIYFNGEAKPTTKDVFGIIETPIFYSSITGIENLEYFCAYEDYNIEHILFLANEFRLGKNELQKKVCKYSLGMKQKLALILALSSKRPLLVLDEPTNGLDLEACATFNKLLTEKVLKDETAAIISSHNIVEMQEVCDVMYFLNNTNIAKCYDKKINSAEILYEFDFLDVNSCVYASKFVSEFLCEFNQNKMKLKFNDASFISPTIQKLSSFGLIEVKRIKNPFLTKSIEEMYNDCGG